MIITELSLPKNVEYIQLILKNNKIYITMYVTRLAIKNYSKIQKN